MPVKAVSNTAHLRRSLSTAPGVAPVTESPAMPNGKLWSAARKARHLASHTKRRAFPLRGIAPNKVKAGAL